MTPVIVTPINQLPGNHSDEVNETNICEGTKKHIPSPDKEILMDTNYSSLSQADQPAITKSTISPIKVDI